MTLKDQAASLSIEEIASLLSLQQLQQERIEELHSVYSELDIRHRELESNYSSLEHNNRYLEDKNQSLENKQSELESLLVWYQRQLFGQKTERRIHESDPRQLFLGEMLPLEEAPPPPKEAVKSYERRNRKKPLEGAVNEKGLRFDDSVPVETIEIPNPELEGLSEEDYEFIEEKVIHRLAQLPGPFVVLKYVRKVAKLKEQGKLVCPPAPPAVIEKSYADVSFLVGLLLDKFLYHLPLYRQHQRLAASGISLSRSSLTYMVQRSSQLLEPIFNALLSSVVQSEVLLMDETPIKAGRQSKGKMQKGYFWPVMGDKGEIAFLFNASRGQKVVREALSEFCGVLVTDGYKVYERYAESVNTAVHAQCWVHARRYFIKAEKSEPEFVAKALKLIADLYRVEDEIVSQKLEEDAAKVLYRREHSRPVVDEFFSWTRKVLEQHALLPSNPFTKACHYALKREEALRVFLEYPDVPLDTNEVERALRPIPMGRKNFLFCWTEVGARHVGIAQSLIQSCRMQGIDPYTYLVDVLQRIDTHPAREVHLLTPRLWKENFADAPMESDIYRRRKNTAK